MTRTALIIGATGGFGGAVAGALARRGWRLVALTRRPETASQLPHLPAGIRWVAGDAMNAADVVAAAKGADLIVHGANPPGYRNWRETALPMLASTIAAAKASGARVVLPGNIYNYGPDAWPVISETSPQHPVSRKGAVRVEMERMLAEAAAAGVRALIVRAGDFIGGHAAGSWLSAVMVKPGRLVRRVVYPGRAEAGHAFAYLPDLAETVARLAEREAELEAFAVFNFAGHYVEPGIDFARAVREAAGVPHAPIRPFPWLAVTLVAPFVSFFRELREMRYLWQNTIRLDNRKLVAFLGEEPHTPLPAALARTLAELGCLPASGLAATAAA